MSGITFSAAKNHKEILRNYLQDGRCEISNNAAERRAKSYAIGRKAFLFHTSTAGAEASAVMYSIVETAKVNNLNVFQYLYTVLLYMPDYKNEPAGIEKLLPWSDFIKERCSGLMLKIKHRNTMNHCLFKAKDTKGAVGNTVDYSSLTTKTYFCVY